jgi:hypothetical protein
MNIFSVLLRQVCPLADARGSAWSSAFGRRAVRARSQPVAGLFVQVQRAEAGASARDPRPAFL